MFSSLGKGKYAYAYVSCRENYEPKTQLWDKNDFSQHSHPGRLRAEEEEIEGGEGEENGGKNEGEETFLDYS